MLSLYFSPNTNLREWNSLPVTGHEEEKAGSRERNHRRAGNKFGKYDEEFVQVGGLGAQKFSKFIGRGLPEELAQTVGKWDEHCCHQ